MFTLGAKITALQGWELTHSRALQVRDPCQRRDHAVETGECSDAQRQAAQCWKLLHIPAGEGVQGTDTGWGFEKKGPLLIELMVNSLPRNAPKHL